MGTRSGGRVAALCVWSSVMVIGGVILAVVFGLNLFPRLDDGGTALHDLQPAFRQPRVVGTAAGVGVISDAVEVAGPLMTPSGGGALETAHLVKFLSQQTGLSQAQVLAAVAAHFPHLAGLLEALPLSSVSAELPGFEAFVGHLLKLPTAAVVKAVQVGYPGLYQAITYLPKVTSQWYDIPGTAAMTMFAGGPDPGVAVHTMPQFVRYLSEDLVPAVAAARPDVEVVASTSPPLTAFPPALTVAGGLITLYSLGIIILLLARVPEPAGSAGLVDGILDGRPPPLGGGRERNLPDDLVTSILT